MRQHAFCIAAAAVVVSITACSGGGEWYRGNTHTHTLWSDGDAAPEKVVAWYKDHDYDWLAITDHDVLLRGDRWKPVADDGRLTVARLGELQSAFGEDWVFTRDDSGFTEMRLKTVDELRDRFETPDGFLLIEGLEISDHIEDKPLHFNVFNLPGLIDPQGGENILEAMERNLAAVNLQADSANRNMLATINHTNWKRAVSAEQLALMDGTHLFEVYNGSTECNNYGNGAHPGMDEVWDIANSIRLTQLDLPPLYGIATDDAHHFFEFVGTRSNPGRAWIMVRADTLTTDAILNAIRAGDFYSSTGVELKDVQIGPEEYVVKVAGERGVTYTTQFLGTRIAHGIPGKPGVVLKETTGRTATYVYRGDEIYVRAKVISSRMQTNPLTGEEAPEFAWTQPVVPEGPSSTQ